MSLISVILNSFRRGIVQLLSRKALLFMMVAMPLLCAWFLLDLLSPGSAHRVPVAIVNLDNSSMSRSLERNLDAMQGVNITKHYTSHAEAMQALQRGEVLGFFFIPERLEELTLAGHKPRVSYYINYAYFTPASSQLKGFKTVSMLANGAIAKTTLDATGLVSSHTVDATLQPILTHVHAVNNPWNHYGYYLNLSFLPCLLALFIMLTVVTTVGNEWKYNTSREWLENSGGSIMVAVTGKILPQTFIYMVVGWAMQFMMFRLFEMPLNCNPWNMIGAMALFVMASQAFALLMLCVAPNYRYAATLCTLLGMISFSFCGFSLPLEATYPWVNALGNIMPVRHFFVISIDQALNGIDLYFSRLHYAVLIGFIILPIPFLFRIKRECKKPVYVP